MVVQGPIVPLLLWIPRRAAGILVRNWAPSLHSGDEARLEPRLHDLTIEETI